MEEGGCSSEYASMYMELGRFFFMFARLKNDISVRRVKGMTLSAHWKMKQNWINMAYIYIYVAADKAESGLWNRNVSPIAQMAPSW